MTDQPLSAEELRKLRDLLEVEEIKKVRLLYSQLMDHGDLDGLASIFAEDALCEFGPYGVWHGRKEIRANYGKVQETNGAIPFAALHANTNHWVELTGPTSAVGRCYLLDVITRTERDKVPFIWIGLYDEEYRKVAGAWKIQRTSLQFFWPERHLMPGFPSPMPGKR